jgi:hypothetical protein
MKQRVYLEGFRNAFKAMDREDNFTYEGQEALYNWLIDLEDDTGEEQELDIISLCCEFSEYASLEDFQADYNSTAFKTIEDIQNETAVIMIDDTSFIIQSF